MDSRSQYTSTPSGQIIRPSNAVPFYSQFASPELINDIIYHRRAAESDPRWAEFGFADKDEYAFWAWRGCGPACLKSAVEALGGPQRSMAEWVRLGMKIDGFIFSEKVGPGKPSGWVHAALANLAENCGLSAGCEHVDSLNVVSRFLEGGSLLIASVTPELGESLEITRKSGHLVLIHACSNVGDGVEAVCIHNPSGRTNELQAEAWIGAERFQSGFSGRLIHISR